jgi:Ser/Thr protein kinase RdoA (MazF antagonist)
MVSVQHTRLARRIGREHYAAEPTLELLSAVNNLVFRLRLPDGDRILKLAGGEAGSERVRKELALVERLRAEGIPVPTVEHAGTADGRAYFVMASAGDETVFDRLGRSDETSSSLFEQMGTVQACIHGVSLPRSGSPDASGIRPHDVPALLEGIRRWAESLAREGWLRTGEVERVAGLVPPDVEGTSLCHGDFHAAQCLVRGDRIRAVVDWESAWSGNPTVDLALAHAYLDSYAPPALVRRFLEAYGAERPLPAGYERDYLPVRVVHVLSVMRVWHRAGPAVWEGAVRGGRVGRALELFREYSARL